MTSRRKNVLVVLVILAGIIVVGSREFLLRMQDLARKASCRPELLYLASTRYARKNEGMFPPLAPMLGKFTYDTKKCGEFTFSVADHVCEFDKQGPYELPHKREPELIDDWSYAYLGYVLENELQGLAFLKEYLQIGLDGGRFEDPIRVAAGKGNCGGDKLNRLRLSLSTLDTDECSNLDPGTIPVVVEWPENHRYPGGKVIYLDGHEEFVDYPGKFPMTERFIEGLRTFDILFSST